MCCAKEGSRQMRDRRLAKMKRVALAFLLAAVVLWLLSVRYGWVWAEAFAEAAVVGGLADWFAVTALFRRPLGLPIPHTGIVARQQERIGRSIGQFLREMFLSRDVVERQLAQWQPLERVAKWLQTPGNAGAAVRSMGVWWQRGVSDERRGSLRTAIASEAESALQALPVRKIARFFIGELLADDRHREVFAPVFARLAVATKKHEALIAAGAVKDAPLRDVPVLGRLSEAMAGAFGGMAVDKAVAQLSAAAKDLHHPLHDRIAETLREMDEEFDEGRELPESWQRWRVAALQDGRIRSLIERGLELIEQEAQRRQKEGSADGFGARLAEILPGVATRLVGDGQILKHAHEALASAAVHVLHERGEDIEQGIGKIVASWETTQLVDQLEERVGSDLQFVRINGTVIGGCIGLVMHATGLLVS